MDLILGRDHEINVTINDISPSVDIKLTQIGSNVTKYDGAYDVVPTVEGTSLPTASKYLEQDINIKAIPFYEVSNQFDGQTIFIAKEIE